MDVRVKGLDYDYRARKAVPYEFVAEELGYDELSGRLLIHTPDGIRELRDEETAEYVEPYPQTLPVPDWRWQAAAWVVCLISAVIVVLALIGLADVLRAFSS